MASNVKKARCVLARPRVTLSPGDSVRVARELQEMTQAQLAHASGIPQGTISSIEKGRVRLGAERAEKLARALKVHPAVLLWPHWEAGARALQRAIPGVPQLTWDVRWVEIEAGLLCRLLCPTRNGRLVSRTPASSSCLIAPNLEGTPQVASSGSATMRRVRLRR